MIGKKRDDLQSVMGLLRTQKLKLAAICQFSGVDQPKGFSLVLNNIQTRCALQFELLFDRNGLKNLRYSQAKD